MKSSLLVIPMVIASRVPGESLALFVNAFPKTISYNMMSP